MTITDVEYEKLVKRLEFHDTMRNNLLAFSFTAVLTILGVALEIELDGLSAWICLLPYLLIIPFAARIANYRLSSAHISAFLRYYASDRVVFEIGAERVNEKYGIKKGYKLIAFLVNHEMVLLGLASSLVFYVKYVPCLSDLQCWHYIVLLIPLVLNFTVFFVAHSTNDYDEMIWKFKDEWEQHALEKK